MQVVAMLVAYHNIVNFFDLILRCCIAPWVGEEAHAAYIDNEATMPELCDFHSASINEFGNEGYFYRVCVDSHSRDNLFLAYGDVIQFCHHGMVERTERCQSGRMEHTANVLNL